MQELLEHESSKTTEIYTHLTEKSIQKTKSLFDDLKLKYLSWNWETKTSLFYLYMESLGSFIACITKLYASRREHSYSA